MQYSIVALALAAAASAREISAGFDHRDGVGRAMVFNRCPYPIYLWSIDKQMGCPETAAKKLETGDFYTEEMQDGNDGGISIKLSKSTTCAAKEITQLEYKLVNGTEKGWLKNNTNFLDMSYVDCKNSHGDCPGRLDGYYLQSGNQKDADETSGVNNEHCPVFHVEGGDDVANVAYILDFDRQTKSCAMKANLDLYLCGSEAPNEAPVEAPKAPKPSESSKPALELLPKPSPKVEEKPKPSPATEEPVVVAAAAVPETPETTPAPKKAPVVKTEIVYVTKFVDAKRHAHGRRHHH